MLRCAKARAHLFKWKISSSYFGLLQRLRTNIRRISEINLQYDPVLTHLFLCKLGCLFEGLCWRFHAERLVRSAVVVKVDPIFNGSGRVLKAFSEMPVDALFFQRPNDTLGHPVLLGQCGLMTHYIEYKFHWQSARYFRSPFLLLIKLGLFRISRRFLYTRHPTWISVRSISLCLLRPQLFQIWLEERFQGLRTHPNSQQPYD